MDVPFVDLRQQTQAIKSEIMAAIEGVVDSAQFCLGPEVEAFEREMAAQSGVAHGVAVNTGTSALQLALHAAGVGPGDEVITVPMTFLASAAAITYLGAHPVYVDVDPERLTLDPRLLEAAITPKTRAILPVHLYGQPADMDPILELAARHGIPVIEDACQAHLATYKGKTAGSLGRAAALSFYPGKNLGAFGEGGMVLTNDAGLAQTMRVLRDWGQTSKYNHELAGYNFRMDGIQGAILRVKLRHLAGWTGRRQELASRYAELLKGMPLTIPRPAADSRHVYHLFTILVDDRDGIRQRLAEHGIGTGIHYPIPVHLQKAYPNRYKEGDFPVTESTAKRTLSLPLFPEMTHEQQDAVASALTQVFGGVRA